MDLIICLKALGDPTRFTIFSQLLIRKHCTRSLACKTGISESAVSQHLKVLKEAGLIQGEKYGYHRHYLPTQEAMDFLADAFEKMRQASLDLNQMPDVCQCEFRRQTKQPSGNTSEYLTESICKKETGSMRIAVTYDNGEIFQHFGHTGQFKLYDVQEGKITHEQVVDTNGSGHGALAGFLKAAQVDALICGGIGMGAQMALADAGIQLYAGVQGSADKAAKALAEDRLVFDPNAHCDHHQHHEGDCGHAHCGEHHCHGN